MIRPSRRAPRPPDERGNTLAMFIVLLPIILGAFGMGVDTARNVYIRMSLQNALDMATVSGAAVTTISPSGQVVIDPAGARRTVEQMYALNRGQKPAVSCSGPGTPVPGAGVARCWQASHPPKVTAGQVSYEIREQSRNAFLGLLGAPTQTYTLRSTAVINQTTQ
jgi:Flp pilus assembly protein TadG